VYGCQTFGLVAQGSVPIRLSAVRTRGSQEVGCRSRGVEFAPDSPLEERVSSEPVSESVGTAATIPRGLWMITEAEKAISGSKTAEFQSLSLGSFSCYLDPKLLITLSFCRQRI